MPASDEQVTDESEQEEELTRNKKKRARNTAKPKKSRSSKGKGKAAAGDDDDDDSESDLDLPKKGKKKASRPAMSDQEIKLKACELVRLLMCAEIHKKPLSRADIQTKVLPNMAKEFPIVLNNAKRMARQDLAFEIVELRQRNTGLGTALSARSKKGNAKGSDEENDGNAPAHEFIPGKMYCLRSLFSTDLVESLNDQEEWEQSKLSTGFETISGIGNAEQMSHVGILYVVLALILVNGRSIPDDQLRTYMRKVDILGGQPVPLHPSTAPSFGATTLTFENLLNTFVKQTYLEKGPNHMYTQQPGKEKEKQKKRAQAAQQAELDALGAKLGSGAGGDPSQEWRWGPRADAEIGEVNVAKFIEQFYEDPEATEARTREMKKTLQKNLAKAAGSKLVPAVKD